MKRLILLVFYFAFAIPCLWATHNIAGEITVKCLGGNLYEATITTYTNTDPSLSPPDRCELIINWGDGDSSIAYRVNGPSGACNPPATMGVQLTSQGFPFTKQNIYRSTHLYSPGDYHLFINDPNRIFGIANIPNSGNIPFYLETHLIVDPNIGCNSTPYLTTYPLDEACMNHCFYHNPGAVDPDNDSLSYRIGPCLLNGNPIPGYLSTNFQGGSLTIDPVTGDLAWCTPQGFGIYNLVIYIDEWKRFPNGERHVIGTVARDMSIEVASVCNNDNPVLPDLPDLCVDAGNTVNFSFPVTDPNSDLTKLEGFGAPFQITPAATVTPNTIHLPTPYSPDAVFNWVTTCDRVRLQPWVVTFKATDNGSPALSDIESVSITVVSPGPAFLNANPQGSQMLLDWGVNPCNPATNMCKGYRIYRRQNPTSWNHLPCETGVPAYTGFVYIGSVTGINNVNFVDNNGGAGLIPGTDYCYRVCAYFNDGAESYSSPEACAELLRDVPAITNVDVMNTGTNNDIFVRWENAIPDNINFDTIANPGPWVLTLQRSPGFTFAMPTTVATLSATVYLQLPNSFVDTGLNTADSAYTYRITFEGLGGGSPLGVSQPASSVYLTTTPSDNTVTLSWQHNVPWTNFEYAIYRFNTVTSLWDSIALAPAGNSYVDDSLLNDQQYCYYISAHGSYFTPTLPSTWYNRSQEACATPHDYTPPCAPVLYINSDCFIGLNQLFWTNPMHMNCGTDDVVTYHLYYSAIEGEPLTLHSTFSPNDTTVIFRDLLSVAGCYAVSALDSLGNESPLSNMICVDNCPEYMLPNVFTPNGDGINDLFIPFPYRNVKEVDVKIYDRWGVLLFETKDPNIYWDGRDMQQKKLCTDGVYYYTCVVSEVHLSGIVQRELKGFVQLFGKDTGPTH
jgi:gliding motility-associated-like protein